MVWQGIGIAPDRYAFVLFFPSLLIKRTRAFLLDWIPFLLILLSYDFLRGLTPLLHLNVNYWAAINFDKFFFGQVPTITLQHALFNPNHLNWYDYLASIFYFLHFALPLAFGYILWLINKDQFRRFTTGLLVLSYSAWATYLIFPAAPPWLASQNGFIPHLDKILNFTLSAFPAKNLPTVYAAFNPNDVAAVPSLHAAYPFLVFLFSLKFFGKKALWFIPYLIGIWWSIVYLGEHYVFDVITGIIYAAFSFILANGVLHHVKFHTWLKKVIAKRSA